MKPAIPGALIALLLAAPAPAQVLPAPGPGDPRLQAIDYREGQVVELRGAPGYEMMLELSPDEQVQSVALGDSAGWQVSVSKDADRLFIKPVQAGSATNMTVVTSVRLYHFDLVAQGMPSPDMPYTVRFHYPSAVAAAAAADPAYVDVSSALRRTSRYKISGDRFLRPSSVTTDGSRTYIAWPRNVAIPAVYALDRFGRETLANGMMGTDDVYVIDGVPQKLAFRIDRSVARAEAVRPRKAR